MACSTVIIGDSKFPVGCWLLLKASCSHCQFNGPDLPFPALRPSESIMIIVLKPARSTADIGEFGYAPRTILRRGTFRYAAVSQPWPAATGRGRHHRTGAQPYIDLTAKLRT